MRLVKPVTNSSFNILIGSSGIGVFAWMLFPLNVQRREFSFITLHILLLSQTLREREFEKVKSTKRSLWKSSNENTLKAHRNDV